VELYFHSPNTPSWSGARLKAQGQLYLTVFFLGAGGSFPQVQSCLDVKLTTHLDLVPKLRMRGAMAWWSVKTLPL